MIRTFKSDSARAPQRAGLTVTYASMTAILALFSTGCQATKPTAAPAAFTQAQQAATSPTAALARLKEGNARYVEGRPLGHDWAKARAATAGGQYPYAIILSCVDSRTASEIIFDQGFGEVFNARVAGNVLDDDLLGSMEFACKLAGAGLIAVVGHTQCGAIKGACAGAQLGHLTGLLEKIRPAIQAATGSQPANLPANAALLDEIAKQNVRLVLEQIRVRSAVLSELIQNGQVGLVGGIYDLKSGKVSFFEN